MLSSGELLVSFAPPRALGGKNPLKSRRSPVFRRYSPKN
jgi:hypothetical protein